jgi:hypothetical protein
VQIRQADDAEERLKRKKKIRTAQGENSDEKMAEKKRNKEMKKIEEKNASKMKE